MKKIFLAIIALLLPISSFAQTDSNEGAKGHLFIHGGAGTTNNQQRPFVELAGGAGTKMLVVPFASQPPYTPEERGIHWAGIFRNNGTDADYVAFKREDADLPENLSKLDGVTAIWFPGGSQTLLRNHLIGTVFLERIKEIYRNGGVIGGASAGASVMSKAMPSGGISEGFGFIDFAIIHQHFSEWERQNILLNYVQEQNIAGIGIDEKTAVIFNGITKTFEVIGDGTVTVYEPQSTGIKTQILSSGDRFTINTAFESGVINTGGYGMGLTNFNTDKNTVSRNEEFTVTFRLRNMGQDVFPGGRTGVALVNDNGNIVGQVMGVGNTGVRNPNTQTSVITRNCYVPNFAVPGQYRLMIVVRQTGEEWRFASLPNDGVPNSRERVTLIIGVR